MLGVMESAVPEVWLEVSEPRLFALPSVEHYIGAADAQLRAACPPCRCWRCRGGIAQSDRSALDRLLGLHLSRQSQAQQDAFLVGWRANPRHDAQGYEQLQAWIRIGSGSEEPHPIYETVEVSE